MNYRIEEKGAFELCGLSAEISVIDGQNYVQIPKFWDSMCESGSIDRFHCDLGLAADVCVHAALYNFREGAFSYMICYHTPEGGAPAGYSTLSVPAFTWAVFSTPEHPGSEGTEQIQGIWKRIFPEWFPTSGYEHADGPELEMYFNRGNGRFISEVWIPVIKK